MFERTALPAGPRVISARLPAARSVSIAAYVLAGSRLEAPGQVGVAHFMEHITFKGTTAYPSTRAISEAIEGVGGSFNAATDRESTVYWVRVPRREAARAMDVIGELIVRPRLAGRGHPERADGHHRGDPLVPRRPVRVLPDPVPDRDVRRRAARSRDLRRGGGHPGAARRRPSTTSGGASTGRPTRSSRSSATCRHEEATSLTAAAFGTGNGAIPGYAPAPALPAGERVRTGKRDTSQAQVCLGVPALHRDHPDSWTLAVLNAVLGDGMSSRLFLSVREELGLAYDVSSGLVDYADAGALEISAGRRSRPVCRPRWRRSSSSWRGCATSWSPTAELTKAKRYLSGGLELRMDDTRHVASWIGGQEALHDRVLTLDEALAAVDAVDAPAIQRLAGQLFHDDALRLAAVAPARHLRGLEPRLRLPA